MKKLIVLALILVFFIAGYANADGLVLFKKHDGVIYKVELTVDKKADKICALLYKNRDIEEVYNIVIENRDRFPIFPESFRVDDSGNRKACFVLSEVPDNFSLFVIKFDKEALAVNIGFPNIDLALIPGIKDF